MSNRKKISILVCVLFLLTAVISFEVTALMPKTTLTVYSQYDCINPDLFEDFTKETGIKIEYTVLPHESDADAVDPYAQCDVLLADAALLSQLEEQDLLLPLDESQFSDLSRIDERFFSAASSGDDWTAIPCLWTAMGLIYDPAATNVRVTGWSALFGEDFSGQVVMPSASREAYAVALAALGTDVNTNKADQLDAAEAYLTQQMVNVAAYCSPSELAEQLQLNGKIIAPCYGATAIDLLAAMPGLSFVIPSEGSWCQLLCYAIPSSTQHQEEAYLLLDFLCQSESLAKNAAYSGYSTVSQDAYELLDPSWQANPLAYPAGSDWPPYPLLNRQDSQLQIRCQAFWGQLRGDWSSQNPQ